MSAKVAALVKIPALEQLLNLTASGIGSFSLFLNDYGRLAANPAGPIRTSGPAHEAGVGDIDQGGDLDLTVGFRDQAQTLRTSVGQVGRGRIRMSLSRVEEHVVAESSF